MLIKILNEPRFHISIKLRVMKYINSLTLTLICEFNINQINVNTYIRCIAIMIYYTQLFSIDLDEIFSIVFY